MVAESGRISLLSSGRWWVAGFSTPPLIIVFLPEHPLANPCFPQLVVPMTPIQCLQTPHARKLLVSTNEARRSETLTGPLVYHPVGDLVVDASQSSEPVDGERLPRQLRLWSVQLCLLAVFHGMFQRLQIESAQQFCHVANQTVAAPEGAEFHTVVATVAIMIPTHSTGKPRAFWSRLSVAKGALAQALLTSLHAGLSQNGCRGECRTIPANAAPVAPVALSPQICGPTCSMPGPSLSSRRGAQASDELDRAIQSAARWVGGLQ